MTPMAGRGRSLPNGARWLGRALRHYLSVAAYLYLCFAALLFYKTMILAAYGVDVVHFGVAAGKALVLAKFMLIADKMGARALSGRGTRLLLILRKSVIIAALLIVLSAIEAVLVALLHQRTVAEAAAGHRIGEVIAESLLLILVLIPYFAVREVDTALGEGKLMVLLRSRA
jgi:hypothetical protein